MHPRIRQWFKNSENPLKLKKKYLEWGSIAFYWKKNQIVVQDDRFLPPSICYRQIMLLRRFNAVADPGFSWRGELPKWHYFAIFLPKLHENERILTPLGAHDPGGPMDPPMQWF